MEHSFQDYTEFPLPNDVSVTKFNCNSGFNFTVDDKLDCPKEKDMMTNEFPESLTASSGHTSANTAVDSCKSSLSGGHFNDNVSINESHFSGDELCVPYDDLAELEWLSNFVEESYSTDDLHLFIPNAAANSTQHPPLLFPTRARSKRSRAAPCGWSTPLLLHVSRPSRRREPSGRKCLHCASEKTPQWRTGPMGPKTLCNACGVRFKSGRLVPEYRPASSPTFIYSKHSNSHRKVLELRRQKISLSSNMP